MLQYLNLTLEIHVETAPKVADRRSRTLYRIRDPLAYNFFRFMKGPQTTRS